MMVVMGSKMAVGGWCLPCTIGRLKSGDRCLWQADSEGAEKRRVRSWRDAFAGVV
jgi:hypothetical protein